MAESNSNQLSCHAKDETGNVYGKLTVVEFARSQNNIYWLCRCECGAMTTVCGSNLRTGITKSCGCVRYTQGGGHGTTEYTSLREMKSRCYNPNATGYVDYGGKGTVVCERWRTSFVNFLADMGKKPSPRHSIERIDNDGHYSCGHCKECLRNDWPANCRWATRDEQARNRSNTRMLTFKGETMCLKDWARKLGISQHAIRARLERGLPLVDALSSTKYGKRHKVSRK
jgi:hypothetical protein